MSFFQTNIDPLIVSNIGSSSPSHLSHKTVSDWRHRIVAGGETCNAYYRARSKNESYTHHDDIYKDYANTLKDIFDKVSHCDASTQLMLIQVLQQTLSEQGDDHFGETFMRNFDSILQHILTQFLEITNAPLSESTKMKHIALELLNGVLGACRPFESLSWAMEKLYSLDWSEYHDKDARVKSTIAFVITVQSYGQSVLENLDPKLANEYIASLLNPCKQALSYVDNTLRHTSPQTQQNDETWRLEALTITSTVLDLASFCYDQCAELKLQEKESLFHMANYLLVLVFDKFILNVDLNLSNVYYEQFHTRYIVKAPKSSTGKSEEYSARVQSKEMMDCVSRCLELARRHGTTFDKLLLLRQHIDDPMIRTDSSENVQSRYSFSNDGIISALALSIFDRYLSGTSTGAYLLPMLVEPVWIGRQCLGMLMNLIKNPQDTPRVDKSLLILLYLADNVDDDIISITLDDLDKEFTAAQDDDDQKLSLVKCFQMLTSMTSMADDPKLRFLGHQLIARFIEFGRDDTRLFILTELLGNCPYPTMRTAAIGLLKNQVDRSFRMQAQQVRPNFSGSPFCTKLLLDKFFPMIYEKQAATIKVDHFKKADRDAFWEKYSYHMQALNFYYYLMMRDEKDNVTCIWGEESRKWMKSHYLGPLEHQCALLSQSYHDMPLNNNNGDDGDNVNGEMMQLSLMTDMINQVNNMARASSYLVN